MSTKVSVSLDIELNCVVLKALEERLIPRVLDESKDLEDLKSAAFQLLEDGMAVKLPADDPSYNRSVFTKEAVELGGFPKIVTTYSNVFYYYLRQGNMVQLNYNPESDLYDDVLFVLADSIYYTSVKSLGLYRYNVKKSGTEDYKDPSKWKKVPLSKKASRNKGATTYLRLNLNAGVFKGKAKLDGDICKKYKVFGTGTHAIIWHRLVYFLFNQNVDFKEFNDNSVNHMLGGSRLYLDLLENSNHFSKYYADDVNVTFAELQSHPMMLELCNSKANIAHGKYVDNWGFRCIPVSVYYIPEDNTGYSEYVVELGKDIFNRVLTMLEYGYEISPYVNSIIKRCLENLRIY